MYFKPNLLKDTLTDIKSKKLIGVSGGPDSMFLLNLFKDHDIVVVHVNYNKREESYIDEDLVRFYCTLNNIPCEVLSLQNSKTIKGNFQDWAREERYQFYRKIYKKYNCDYLLLAHHKDDYLESAIMQEKSKRKPNHFGIRPTNFFYDMQIIRPLIFTYWKGEIENKCISKNIPCVIDYTNDQSIYTRNIIRKSLKRLSKAKKEEVFQKYIDLNESLTLENEAVDKSYETWRQTNFDCQYLRDQNSQEIELKLLYKLIHTNYESIKISSKKLLSIAQFIKSSIRTSKYKIKDNVFLYKKKDKLFFSNFGWNKPMLI